ncbi:hypothetical protein AMD24_00627 [Candidatus Xiphinematobacter sp. Idaho Grape]|nr:hypothetical protein AMD24_00627 [Candidatus Xiphinematobacter sp. Idaho Grape]
MRWKNEGCLDRDHATEISGKMIEISTYECATLAHVIVDWMYGGMDCGRQSISNIYNTGPPEGDGWTLR